MTQQQKNNKRQRATQDQLVTLELEFNKNPTPTAATRERIAQEINMTERSVQIWFQNRRAKIKMLAKKSIETGEGCDAIPESMRQYLAMYFDPNKPGLRDSFGRTAGYAVSGVYPNEPSSSGKVVINHFTCRSLTIGSWRRIGQNSMDLVIFYSPDKACMTYYINNDSAGYKIEYPFSYIKNITLASGDQNPQPTGAPTPPAGVVVELNRPPLFYMDSSNSGGFYQCGDFTEDQQASQILVHHLGGHPKVLGIQLSKLVSLEAFQNRFTYNNFAAMPPPVSPPFIPRPASQPNHFAPAFINPYQESRLGMDMHGPRGHKRQRSRSVPVAIDFSTMQALYPQYNVQQPPAHFNTDSGIFAPIPQSTHALAAPLRVDTSASFGLDLQGYPMSAPATGSPTEFASPSMFTTGAPGDVTPVAPSVGNPFNMSYVSAAIDTSDMSVHASSPYAMTPVDPMIANHSPPLSAMHHQTPPDMFAAGPEQQQSLPDDGTVMFAKHNVNYSVPSAMGIEASSFDLPIHNLPGSASPSIHGDFSTVTALDNVDPSALAHGS